jgi:hypothetical protein
MSVLNAILPKLDEWLIIGSLLNISMGPDLGCEI